ncbi:hypothetical protein H9649_10215 [Sporosarcina sp. Sa2YVA2]|uniref:Cytochrome oxidase subunit II copper A binding domain-containing protein n=1 Tax=Sporosarcina quadrami TaxID=2762234 RepID=A0ABR8UAW8_9BACL|nr:hypothetical protein [Sporosarcina quadrami]MBD7984960.1 hypothetical protein [Sporosarcina quadrami]
MKNKRFLIFSLLFGALLVLGACSEDKKETTETDMNGKEFLMISGDTVSEQGGCVLASRYSAGDKLVFRMNALDSRTNEQVKDANLKVHLSTGEELDMVYGTHGDEDFWVVAYPVTAETPTGSLEYYVTGEAGDLKGEFRPFNVAPSLLSIVDVDGEAATEPEEEPDEEEVDLSKVETNQNVDVHAVNFEFAGPKGEKVFYVKAGEEVKVSLTSDEGMHGLAIEDTDINIKDANGEAKFTPEKPGEYKIYCSVFCGAGHSDMTAKLVVVE